MADEWRGDLEGTVLDWLDARLSNDPDGPFLDLCGTRYTAAELDLETNRIANGLAALGIEHGLTVATLLDNSPEAVIVWFAILKLGAIAVPMNTALKGPLLTHVLTDSGASVLVVQADLLDRVTAIEESLDDLRHVVVVGAAETPAHAWADLLSADASRPDVQVLPADLATIVYTGGTTGPSKGCALSHNYHLTITRDGMTGWGRTAQDVVWSPLPVFHFNAITQLILGTLYCGGRAALSGRFSVSGFWPEINRTGATIASLLGSPAVFIARADPHPQARLSGTPEANTTLRLMTAAPMPPEIDELLGTRFGIRTFSYGYGATEASLISWLPPGVPARVGSAGIVNEACFEVKIFDDDDRPLPVGEAGEIVVRPRAPHVMFEGYWKRPEATLAAYRNLWFHTGDIGRIDADGYLYFVDRKADYMRRRGENISSWEVEKVFHEHPDVVDVAVYGVPSDAGEDDVKMSAVLREGATLTELEMCRWAIDQLPYFAVPRYFEFRSELPRSATGRLTKSELRDPDGASTTWDREAAGVTFEHR